MIEELADLTARMLRDGVCHNDLHVGNVLILPDAPAGRRFCVVDLHRVRLGRVGERGAARMLSFLADSTARLGVSATDRVRFLRRVLAGWLGREEARGRALRAWAERVRVRWERHRRRYMRRRTRRCLQEGDLFARERAGGFRIFRRRDVTSGDLLALVDMHRRAVAGEASACQVRKAATRAQISVCPGPGGRRFLVKAFLRNSARDRLKDLIRPCGRARDAWIGHRGFCVRGVPTPEAVALLEATSKLSGRPDYVIMEALDVVGDLRQIVFGLAPDGSQRDGPALGPQERRELPLAIADLFCLLAERQVRHSDTKPSNILVTRDERGLRLWLVDLGRAQFDWRWRREHWVFHLAQCNAGLPANVTVLERMRCLRRCGRGRWTSQERLRIAREILSASLRRGAKWLP
jgi:tRNA A-37 threonylcarbamoyl transferase component Bud32